MSGRDEPDWAALFAARDLAAVMSGPHDPLEDLRHHWGEAYMIYHPGPDHWIAVRRDSFRTLHAEAPEELRDMMRTDYLARPVNRDPDR